MEQPKPIVIVDIDGTLAEISHRVHLVRKHPKDWSAFFGSMDKDIIRHEVAAKVNQLRDNHEIVLVTGRPDSYKKQTETWLSQNNIKYDRLYMRRSNDKRRDTEVKQNILNTYIDKALVKLVIDDRPAVIRMWRDNGLEVDDVGDGIEF